MQPVVGRPTLFLATGVATKLITKTLATYLLPQKDVFDRCGTVAKRVAIKV